MTGIGRTNKEGDKNEYTDEDEDDDELTARQFVI